MWSFAVKFRIFIKFRTLLNAEKEVLGGLVQLAEIWNTVNQPASLALQFNQSRALPNLSCQE